MAGEPIKQEGDPNAEALTGTRRDVLQVAAAAMAGVLVPGCALAAEQASTQNPPAGATQFVLLATNAARTTTALSADKRAMFQAVLTDSVTAWLACR